MVDWLRGYSGTIIPKGAGGGGGGPPSPHGSTHAGNGSDPVPNATTSFSGLLSAADKTKLDGIAALATNGVTVQEEGVTVGTLQRILNWIGPSTTVASVGSTTTITTVANDPLTTQLNGVTVGTFQDTLNFTTGFFVSAVAGTSAIRLADTAVTPGTYGSSTLVPVVTVDQQGRVTSVTTAAISGGGSTQYEGVAILDFGPAPSFERTASVSVTGQAAILATSKVYVKVKLAATAEHTVDEILHENIRVQTSVPTPGVGFTIYGEYTFGTGSGTYSVDWAWE